MTIAVSHPGMIGDALWAIPTARELARRHGSQVDFWTSPVVRPAADLISAQKFIRQVVIDEEYEVKNTACGVQPWLMHRMHDPRHGYEACYACGFRETPRVPLPEYISTLHGLPQLPMELDLPAKPHNQRDDRFVVLASRGGTTFQETFREFVRRCRLPVIEVGAPGQAIATDLGAVDMTSRGFIRMAKILSRCTFFVGLLSAPLVVASAFPCVKIGVHDGRSWDMRHVIRTDKHHYPASYDPQAILELIR